MTTIGPSVVIHGELASDEDLLVHGQVKGHVHVRSGTFTVGEEARVRADVRGARVIVRGRLDGSILATERIELTAGAHVEGNLSANQVVIADGAHFIGGVDMGQRTIAAKLAQYKASQASA